VPARRVARDDVKELFPEVVTDDVLFATFCPKDGYADPASILQGYVSRARALGARFVEGAAVTAIERDGDHVAAVRTEDERLATPLVIDAAGAWGAAIARLAGVDLPIQPLRRHIFVTERVAALDRDFPLTIEFESGLYLHRESGGVLLGMGDPKDRPGFDDSVNWEFLPEVVERALARVPVLEAAAIRTGWGGLYEDTPDKHPIVGPVHEVEGFLSAAGFSGHGVMHAPAVGELLAELVVDGRTSLDLSPLRASRFREGALTREHNVV
jgi:sarcosine oxidase subunit beta